MKKIFLALALALGLTPFVGAMKTSPDAIKVKLLMCDRYLKHIEAERKIVCVRNRSDATFFIMKPIYELGTFAGIHGKEYFKNVFFIPPCPVSGSDQSLYLVCDDKENFGLLPFGRLALLGEEKELPISELLLALSSSVPALSAQAKAEGVGVFWQHIGCCILLDDKTTAWLFTLGKIPLIAEPVFERGGRFDSDSDFEQT